MRTFGSNVNGFHDVSDQMIDNLRRRAETHFRRQGIEKAELTSVADFEETPQTGARSLYDSHRRFT